MASLWWGVAVLREDPVIVPAPSVTQALQCPAGTQLDGEVCTCAPGSEWTGRQCAAKTVTVQQPDTRHVTTVDLRRR